MLEYLDYIVKNFDAVGEGLPSIELLVSYGNKLGKLPEGSLIEKNRVPGCISDVYIDASFTDGKMEYYGMSSSQVVGGYVYILSKAFSGLTPNEVVDSQSKIEEFLSKTKLQASLTPSRSNALSNIYLLMVRKAKDYL